MNNCTISEEVHRIVTSISSGLLAVIFVIELITCIYRVRRHRYRLVRNSRRVRANSRRSRLATTSRDGSMSCLSRGNESSQSFCLEAVNELQSVGNAAVDNTVYDSLSLQRGHLHRRPSTEPHEIDMKRCLQLFLSTKCLFKQFEDLPRADYTLCCEAQKGNNICKNRYRDVLPYDNSRVVLKAVAENVFSGYINANYIQGVGCLQKFIAAQGPFLRVVPDFWRMVWETESRQIVMLTNIIEDGKMKCAKYWPGEIDEVKVFDDITVEFVLEEVSDSYVKRTFNIKSGEMSREIFHYHYTAWPDCDSPRDVSAFLDFRSAVFRDASAVHGPVIVHCSAGIGRTGTFIALHYLLSQAKADGIVDVFGCVAQLRQQRMEMVQTEEQYAFLFEALYEYTTEPTVRIGHTRR
ncbi:receptor-type tyrosine-protein phosphatase mu-like [Haliotis rubra]|uniref:receptor-type tyrosine-protein phosphatase mu-like n=1 Tax=Haliotis rubra TaxID=36100 RepID=UPI001EE54035|nr:receptor-type tyrosine-protein phosphatase mu-like [Haliotis rubra]XP_046574245.1 receptor-type tyrosine-protein phosphatase mu-like [Haliotis rubra]